MQRFYLVDGSMVLQTLQTLPSFLSLPTDWLLPLLPHPSADLLGPLLIAPALAHTPEQARDIERARRAFARQLHCSELRSDHSPSALAAHLGRFASFTDSTGQRYGLRLADCRVLAYLPQLLEPRQWQALSAPITEWRIATRDGQGIFLPLSQSPPPTPEHEPFTLSDEQMHRLADAGEPDALLAALGLNPENTPEEHIPVNYNTAVQCIHIWHTHAQNNPSHLDRRVLRVLAERAFSGQAAWPDDELQVHAQLQQIAPGLP